MHVTGGSPTLADAIDPKDFKDMDVEAQAMLAQAFGGEMYMTTSGDQSSGGNDAVVRAAVLLSVAEEAIAKAMGAQPGKGEEKQCWRCHGLTRFASTPLHLFD